MHQNLASVHIKSHLRKGMTTVVKTFFFFFCDALLQSRPMFVKENYFFVHVLHCLPFQLMYSTFTPYGMMSKTPNCFLQNQIFITDHKSTSSSSNNGNYTTFLATPPLIHCLSAFLCEYLEPAVWLWLPYEPL